MLIYRLNSKQLAVIDQKNIFKMKNGDFALGGGWWTLLAAAVVPCGRRWEHSVQQSSLLQPCV